MDTLPYLTSELPGIGGQIKQRVEDFRVDEVSLYEASGQGDHLYLRIEKRGIPTSVAIARLARHMGCRPDHIGSAGLKDAQAITTQTLSIEHGDEARLATFNDRQLRILSTMRHTNKLRTGHLAGNRFVIRIRGVQPTQLGDAQAILDVLAERGVPNYFGPQRFGARGDTAALGEAMLRNQKDEFVAIFLGRPQAKDPVDTAAARDAFDEENYARAMKRWPRHFADQRKALAAFRRKRKPGPAIAAIDKRLRRLFVSAFQSAIFNDVLSARIDTFDQILPGDVAQKVDSGGLFTVEPDELAAARTRAAAFEISPTGPLPGERCMPPTDEAGQIESAILAQHDLDTLAYDKLPGGLKLKGARRSLRFPLIEPALSAGDDEHGAYIELAFTAPSGCYATIVTEELCKTLAH